MEEFKKHGKVGRAALRADMDRKTARKYLAADKLSRLSSSTSSDPPFLSGD